MLLVVHVADVIFVFWFQIKVEEGGSWAPIVYNGNHKVRFAKYICCVPVIRLNDRMMMREKNQILGSTLKISQYGIATATYNVLLVRSNTNLGNIGKENDGNEGNKTKVVLQVNPSLILEMLNHIFEALDLRTTD